ncbi:hypothetical protein [Reyranella sp.]|nr:hypothetical protein [Reyranella sp.]
MKRRESVALAASAAAGWPLVHPPAFLPGTGAAKTEFIGLGSTEITIK